MKEKGGAGICHGFGDEGKEKYKKRKAQEDKTQCIKKRRQNFIVCSGKADDEWKEWRRNTQSIMENSLAA